MTDCQPLGLAVAKDQARAILLVNVFKMLRFLKVTGRFESFERQKLVCKKLKGNKSVRFLYLYDPRQPSKNQPYDHTRHQYLGI